MKRTVIMRDKDLIAFLKKEKKNPLFTSIEVEPVTYQELKNEILIDQINYLNKNNMVPQMKELFNIIYNVFFKVYPNLIGSNGFSGVP